MMITILRRGKNIEKDESVEVLSDSAKVPEVCSMLKRALPKECTQYSGESLICIQSCHSRHLVIIIL